MKKSNYSFRKFKASISGVLMLFLTSCIAPPVIIISPNGNDDWDGSRKKPFRTVERAQKEVKRYLKETEKGTIKVLLQDGVYEISEPITYTCEVPVRDQQQVIWMADKGAQPIISGAMIKDVKGREEPIFIEVEDASRLFDIYVDGKRAIRARTPNEGFYHFDNVEEEIIKRGKGRVPEQANQKLYLPEVAFNELSDLSDEDLSQVRFHAFFKWDNTIRYLSGQKSDNRYVETFGRGMKPWNSMGKSTRFFLENYPEALDAPGEWVAMNSDKLQGISYIAERTKLNEPQSVAIPITEKLVVIKGNGRQKINNITFEGISFKYTNYELPKSGFEPAQAAATVDAAIEINHANNIRFKNCELAHTGQHGIWFRKGVKNCSIQQCYIHDLGAGGVLIGETTIPVDSEDITSYITIENCIIQSGGYNFPSAVGVWIGQSGNNKIVHNDIADFRYTGVSVGWVWGYAPSPAKNNKILYNRIHHIGWSLLSDMAGVYTLGQSEGTEVSHNVVHDIYAYSYGGWGLYTDEGSSHIRMENNLVYKTKTGGFHQHYGRENIIRNNVFAHADKYQLQATRVEEHLSFTFTNNMVIGDKGVLLQGPWEKIQLNMDHNCYWFIRDGFFDFKGMNLQDWQKTTGRDQNSLIAEPGKLDLSTGAWQVNKEAALAIQFKMFDPNEAGVYGSQEWKSKAQLSCEVIQAFEKNVENNRNYR